MDVFYDFVADVYRFNALTSKKTSTGCGAAKDVRDLGARHRQSGSGHVFPLEDRIKLPDLSFDYTMIMSSRAFFGLALRSKCRFGVLEVLL